MSGQLALQVGEREVVAPAVVWETLPIDVAGQGHAAARAVARGAGGGQPR